MEKDNYQDSLKIREEISQDLGDYRGFIKRLELSLITMNPQYALFNRDEKDINKLEELYRHLHSEKKTAYKQAKEKEKEIHDCIQGVRKSSEDQGQEQEWNELVELFAKYVLFRKKVFLRVSGKMEIALDYLKSLAGGGDAKRFVSKIHDLEEEIPEDILIKGEDHLMRSFSDMTQFLQTQLPILRRKMEKYRGCKPSAKARVSLLNLVDKKKAVLTLLQHMDQCLRSVKEEAFDYIKELKKETITLSQAYQSLFSPLKAYKKRLEKKKISSNLKR